MEVATRSRAALAVVAALLVLMPEASRAERYIVGDAARWTWGYNYTDWVIRKGPFFLKDSLGTWCLLVPRFTWTKKKDLNLLFLITPENMDTLQFSCTTPRTRRCTHTACT
jgi:hypothetical protein